MRFRPPCVALCVVIVLAAACTPSPPPGKDAGVRADAGLADAGAQDGAVDASPAPGASVAPPDPAPALTSSELTARARHLVEAVAQDNPALATDILFPREAYLLLRDAKDPPRAWEKSVQAPFARGIRALHKRTKGAARAEFVALEIEPATEILPKHHEWKAPLYRARHARLIVSIDGRPQKIDVAELTSWKGAWYVTQLR